MKNQTSYLLLILSGCLYTIPFLSPAYFWWGSLLFALPLFICITYTQISFLQGALWGVITTSIPIWGLACGLFAISQGPLFARLIFPTAIIIYAPLVCALFFIVGQKLLNLFFKKLSQSQAIPLLVPIKIGAWSMILLATILFLVDYSLILCGESRGYFFLHPLIPLAHLPATTLFLSLFSDRMLIAVIIGINGLAAWFFTQNKTGIGCILLAVWLAIWATNHLYQPVYNQNLPWSRTIHTIKSVYGQQCDHLFFINNLAEQISNHLKKSPDTDIFILTESSFCGSLSDYTSIQEWNVNSLGKPVHLFIGAFRDQDHLYFNTIYWFYDGQLQQFFDKRIMLPFVEQIPEAYNYPFIFNIFFGKTEQLAPSKNGRPLFELNTNIKFVPYICWELFGSKYPDDIYHPYPIIAFCNDRHFPHWMTPLIRQAVTLKSLLWGRDTLFINNK